MENITQKVVVSRETHYSELVALTEYSIKAGQHMLAMF